MRGKSFWQAFVMSATNRESKSGFSRALRLIRGHLPELTDRYGVESLGIFGSLVRGEQREDSDLDILVEFSRTPGLFDFVALKIELTELLEADVDLVMKRALKPHIGERILKEVVQA